MQAASLGLTVSSLYSYTGHGGIDISQGSSAMESYFDVFLLGSETYAECLAGMLTLPSSMQMKRLLGLEHWLSRLSFAWL